MWFDGIRQPGTIYVASVSRGKDSTAMLRAIQLMGWPLDAVCSVDIWFDDDTPAELPPMVAFKDEWDRMCLEWFGVPVTRLCATKRGGREPEDEECHPRESFSSYFYRRRESGKFVERFVGFPMQISGWCKKLKYQNIRQADLLRHLLQAEQGKESADRGGGTEGSQQSSRAGATAISNGQLLRISDTGFSSERRDKARKTNVVHYIGIAADEPMRIARHIDKPDKVLPLVQIGWDEDLCGIEASYMGMLSPTYTTSMRDGCWFCHNQSISQLRRLRRDYPGLWAKLLKLDDDSPVTFHPDGHTVHDFDRRFAAEDEGIITEFDTFRWAMLDEPQLTLFNEMEGKH